MRSSWFNKLSVIVGPRPPFSWLLVCLIIIVALVTVLGSSSSNTFDLVTSTQKPDIYTNYWRLNEQAAVDYLELRNLSLVGPKEYDLCGKERENFVPCYNVTANLLAGFQDGEEFDRHCEISRIDQRCLVRPPKDYKIPLRWPTGRDVIWSGNVKITKDQFLSFGSMTKRLMLLEENQIAFHSENGLIFDEVKVYSRQVAEMIGLGSDSEFHQAGVHTILDIGCGFGSFAAHLVSLKLMAICVAAYEATGSQVQLALERGLPAMIGNFISRQLPYPSLSFDMVHCAQCGINWNQKDGIFLVEVDRLLKPGGYFVLTSPATKPHGSSLTMKKRTMLKPMQEFAEKICWTLMAQQDETFIWQKTVDSHCHLSRQEAIPLCKEGPDAVKYYQPLVPCISGTTSKRWIPIRKRSAGSQLSLAELEVHGKDCFKMSFPPKFCCSLYINSCTSFILAGVQPEVFNEDLQVWSKALKNYWSLLTPLIFSDHPKRPGDEDPLPPFNMIRNVIDMNAQYGGLNAAFQEEKKSVWMMNVVPVTAQDTLPLILDRGFAGVLHDWCEPFPTYPRTYDMIHANGLLSHLSEKVSPERCDTVDLFLEIDRILRPEGWVVISDNLGAIEMARSLATQMRWEARVIDLQNGSDQRLLVCQKPFVKK